MDTFLTVFRDPLQVDINMHPAGLGLCSMRSILGELFAAPSAHFRLAPLVNKHRPVYTSYELKSASLQACNYQKAVAKSLPVNLAAEYHRHLEGLSNRKVKISKKARCLLMTIGIERRAAEEVVPYQVGPWEPF